MKKFGCFKKRFYFCTIRYSTSYHNKAVMAAEG